MIDIHTHIIPNIDDGSKSIEETFEMLKEAAKEGFTDIILTPHYIKEYYETNTNIREYWVKSLNEAIDKLEIPIHVYIGNEIYVSEDMDELIYYKKVSTLNNSRYVLFELPMNNSIKYLDEIIFKIFNLDLIPVLAHPERYSYIQNDIDFAKKLHQKGVLFQSNYGSILGLYGEHAKKAIIKLLKEDLVDFLATDVHMQNSIYHSVTESLRKTEKIIGKERLNQITTINPQKVILNENL